VRTNSEQLAQFGSTTPHFKFKYENKKIKLKEYDAELY
jgi:hypothetical protein